MYARLRAHDRAGLPARAKGQAAEAARPQPGRRTGTRQRAGADRGCAGRSGPSLRSTQWLLCGAGKLGDFSNVLVYAADSRLYCKQRVGRKKYDKEGR